MWESPQRLRQPAPKLPNLVFQALQRVFDSDAFIDYVCRPELDECSGDMTRSEFHPAVQNYMKIPWGRDQTKVGGEKMLFKVASMSLWLIEARKNAESSSRRSKSAIPKPFPNFCLVIQPAFFRILRPALLATH
jgi:hypothetical protein